ncbi:ARM repeat-containing protein [Laetiporus sulphureus 93-53]|uniref:ARM repeat-containing protein n=1 Tax=Laetiporus sulphureus 93-53 TaxID=1314785 RepID=A0A165FCU8_9APHY|nr:ARM repeat-containing protein [Laetiporus sulphureus 93-53]KZT08776.1 ARM repeat-containing protein [Laetiporus sulphureus 93-53]
MGKSQKKRQMRRHNPVRVPDSHLPKGLESASASSSKKDAVLPIIQKMESIDAADRKWACVAVSNLIQNDPSTRRLLQGKNIVGALITRLSDSEEEVVIEAAGALRNLCIDGGFDICAEMYNKNILAPLKTFIPKISATLSQFLDSPKTAPENAQRLVYDFADNVITILWCLSETSNKALNAINQIPLVPFLMSFLASRDKLPVSAVTSAAQCLYVLTDENQPVINEVRSNAAYTACLSSVVQSDTPAAQANGKSKAEIDERTLTFQVLCCGIMRNISPIPPSSIASPVDVDRDIVMPKLEPVLSLVTLPEVAHQAQELITKEGSIPELEKLSLKHTPKSDHKTPSQLDLERLETRLRTVQLALEILTGACATLPDPEFESWTRGDGADADGDEDDDGDDEIDAEADVDMEMDNEPSSKQNPSSKQSTPSTPAFFHTLVSPLLALVQPTPLSFPPPSGPSPHPPTTSALSSIHISALECLNNIFLSLRLGPAGKSTTTHLHEDSGRQIWSELWRALETVGTDVERPGQERRRDMWEIGVGVLWGVASLWKGVLIPEETHVKVLMQLCDAAADPSVKLKCIGTLECLAQHPESVEANRVIADHLLSLLPPSAASPTPTEPLLQAVSALIDIYSDETLAYDLNFRNGRYLDKLVASVEAVRKAVRGIDRKRERELKIRGEEVRDNLVAFIQYRRELGL